MLKNLIKKMVREAIGETKAPVDQSAEIDLLKREITVLKAKVASAGSVKRLVRLREMADQIPAEARGMGLITIIEDGVMKTVPLGSKQDLTDLIERAEKNEIEVFV